ncbi:MAG: LysM peptidoglycan-binding domain-containing protein [Thermoanaerobaculia bacterium]
MFLKGSRYEQARAFVSEDGSTPFPGVRPREIAPAPAVLEHTVQAGDRLDRLARHYYNDDRLWWRIVDANPEVFYGGDLLREKADALPVANGTLTLERMVGRPILIPRAKG